MTATIPTAPKARNPRAPLDMPTPVLARTSRGGTDWVLVGAALSLALIGAVLVWSATRSQLIQDGGNPQSYLIRHLVNVAIGAVLLVAASRFDARLLRWFGPVVYVASLLGLCAVFVVGTTVNGAHAWIDLGGGFQVQPSEFMKLGLIVGTAVMFVHQGRDDDPDAPPRSRDVVRALVMLAVPLGLIMLQPDLGSALVLATAGLGVLVAAGAPTRWIIGLLVVGVLVAVISVKAGLLASYQLDRFKAFANPSADPQGAAYNVTQAHIAIADGGFFGRGLFHGPQTRGGFVPENQTDFVFSVAGEEFGFLGGGLIVALFGVICWRGLRIARTAERTGRLIAVGVVCWLALQAFQNIGMNLGLTPVTGLPLPFVSYGGSSMFAESLAVGLLLAVRRTG